VTRHEHFFAGLIAILLLVLACGGSAFCQIADADAVHITPRSKPQPAVEDPALETGTRPMKVSVNVVLVPVTVTDGMDRLVTGLDQKNFTVFQDKQPQQIRYFSSQDAPVSIGIIFDMSGSMQTKMDRAREAIMEFLETGNPQDEFFVITFSDKPDLLSGFTQSLDDVRAKLINTPAKGETSLFDAIYLGLNEMKKARYERRALLVISDGGDNHSRYTEGEVRSRLEEADTQLFAIGVYDRYFATPEEQRGPEVLTDLANISGGRAFNVDNPNELPDVAAKIGTQLRNQYVVGYVPEKKARDGKWHKIQVKLNPPKGLPPLNVYAKKGFYAPQ
jgi:Ca-activated chloride channel family protein